MAPASAKNPRLQASGLSQLLSPVPDSFQRDSALSRTAFSLTQRCPGERWTVPDTVKLDSALSQTALSSEPRCPWQRLAWLSTIQDSTQLFLNAVSDNAKTEHSITQHSANTPTHNFHESCKSKIFVKILEPVYNGKGSEISWHYPFKRTIFSSIFCWCLYI